MRDLYNKLAAVAAIPDSTYDADNTPAGLSLAGFNSAMLAISVGVGGITFTTTNKIEFRLSHSDDGNSYDLVEQDDVQGVTLGMSNFQGGIVLALTAAHAAPTITRVGYIGNRSFLKLIANFGGTHSVGTPISAMLLKSNTDIRPV